MAQRDENTQALIAALSANDADAALIAWTTLSHGWAEWPAAAQQCAIAAALSSRQAWTASAARRFITDRWTALPEGVQSAAIETLGTLLDGAGGANADRASTVWTFLADHFDRVPSAFAGMLKAERFGAAFAQSDVAADAWDFLTAQWDCLPARLQCVVGPRDMAAALSSQNWRVVVACWDFLNEHWERLPKPLRDVLNTERIAAATLNPIACLAVEEFVAAHAGSLPPDLCRAARKTPESRQGP